MSDVTVSLFVTHIFNINSGISDFISIRSCGDMNIPDFTYKRHCIPKILFSFFFFYGKDHSYITRIALRIRFTDNDVIIKYIYIYIVTPFKSTTNKKFKRNQAVNRKNMI